MVGGVEITEGITLLFVWYNHSQEAPHMVYCTINSYTDTYNWGIKLQI